MIVNRSNIGSILEKAIVNNITIDRLGISLYGKDEAAELENLRIKQRDNPHLKKLINRLETGTKKTNITRPNGVPIKRRLPGRQCLTQLLGKNLK